LTAGTSVFSFLISLNIFQGLLTDLLSHKLYLCDCDSEKRVERTQKTKEIFLCGSQKYSQLIFDRDRENT
jgi:hypothetical protein